MFRLKFTSLTNNRKRRSQRPGKKTDASCDGLEHDTAVDTPKESKVHGRRTSQWFSRTRHTPVTDLAMTMSVCEGTTIFGPRVRCQEQVSGLANIPQTEAVSPVAPREIRVSQPIGYSKLVEDIREEEYPHMNKGNVFCILDRVRTQD